jgi:hypothetical protein
VKLSGHVQHRRPDLGVIAVFCMLLTACCHYPKGHAVKQLAVAPQSPSVTIVAYGDTRTGPWGLGDNAGQAIHGKVVDDILAHDGPTDAVIFTGDAVMTNFPLWRKSYWRCFLSQSNRFRAAGIPFYPSLGNHEVLPGIVPLLKTQELASAQFAIQEQGVSADIDSQVATLAKAYDLGEEPTPSPEQVENVASAEQIDPNSKQGRATLRQWERGISKGNAKDAYKFGQFENNLQMSFYGLKENERCALDAKTFSDDYLVRAKYEYLRPLLRDRSYYSQLIERAGVRVKLIALDTNCLDSQAQQTFFADEVNNFDGSIIVFGHHPPVNYDAKEGWPWDKVPGWGKRDSDPLKSYLANGQHKNIVLWVFGHVHDYQRRGLVGEGNKAVAPILLVAGGGGASLDSSAAPFQWQPATWPAPIQSSAYSQVKIVVTSTAVLVETRGTSKKTDQFQTIDTFTIPPSAESK